MEENSIKEHHFIFMFLIVFRLHVTLSLLLYLWTRWPIKRKTFQWRRSPFLSSYWKPDMLLLLCNQNHFMPVPWSLSIISPLKTFVPPPLRICIKILTNISNACDWGVDEQNVNIYLGFLQNCTEDFTHDWSQNYCMHHSI